MLRYFFFFVIMPVFFLTSTRVVHSADHSTNRVLVTVGKAAAPGPAEILNLLKPEIAKSPNLDFRRYFRKFGWVEIDQLCQIGGLFDEPGKIKNSEFQFSRGFCPKELTRAPGFVKAPCNFDRCIFIKETFHSKLNGVGTREIQVLKTPKKFEPFISVEVKD